MVCIQAIDECELLTWWAAELTCYSFFFYPLKKPPFFFQTPVARVLRKERMGMKHGGGMHKKFESFHPYCFFFAFDEWCLPHSRTKGRLQSVQILYFITHVFIFLFKNYGEKHFVKMLYRDMKLCIIIIYYNFLMPFFRTKRMNLQKYYLQDRSWLCLRWFITIYSCHHHHSMLKLV